MSMRGSREPGLKGTFLAAREAAPQLRFAGATLKLGMGVGRVSIQSILSYKDLIKAVKSASSSSSLPPCVFPILCLWPLSLPLFFSRDDREAITTRLGLFTGAVRQICQCCLPAKMAWFHHRSLLKHSVFVTCYPLCSFTRHPLSLGSIVNASLLTLFHSRLSNLKPHTISYCLVPNSFVFCSYQIHDIYARSPASASTLSPSGVWEKAFEPSP